MTTEDCLLKHYLLRAFVTKKISLKFDTVAEFLLTNSTHKPSTFNVLSFGQ